MKFTKSLFTKQALLSAAMAALFVAAPASAQIDVSELITALAALVVVVGTIYTAILGFNIAKMIGRKTASLGKG